MYMLGSISNFDTYRHIETTPFSHGVIAVSVLLLLTGTSIVNA